MNPTRTVLLTALALVAFAANSLLCRVALGRDLIDPASFTSIRLIAGAGMLLLIQGIVKRRWGAAGGSWASASFLFLYAVAFSFAYRSLSAGTGALILFAGVQATMMLAALRAGERPDPQKWIGIITASAGLVYLVSPGLQAPTPIGALLMTVAGVAWGAYSLLGRTSVDPIFDTAGNFMRSVPFALAVSMVALRSTGITGHGALLAAVSGAITSGAGYVIWYAALSALSTAQAATAQLLVPVLAAVGGVLFLAEGLTLRLVLSSILILGGVGLGLVGRSIQRGTK